MPKPRRREGVPETAGRGRCRRRPAQDSRPTAGVSPFLFRRAATERVVDIAGAGLATAPPGHVGHLDLAVFSGTDSRTARIRFPSPIAVGRVEHQPDMWMARTPRDQAIGAWRPGERDAGVSTAVLRFSRQNVTPPVRPFARKGQGARGEITAGRRSPPRATTGRPCVQAVPAGSAGDRRASPPPRWTPARSGSARRRPDAPLM